MVEGCFDVVILVCLSLHFRFHHQRVPLVILVCGTACVGKSTIATQIAQRLNLPNVLQVPHFLSSNLFCFLILFIPF